jgi:hypothetical protein
VTNDRQYYVGGEEQLWRVAPGEAPRLTPTRTVGARQIWGMGTASYDLTGDGYPEVYLTSQADNKPQTPPPARPSLPSPTSRSRRRDVAQPYAVATRSSPPPAPRVGTSTTTVWSTCSCPRAPQPSRLCRGTRATLIGQPTDGEGADAAGIVPYARGQGRLDDFNLDGLLDRSRSTTGNRPRSGGTSAPVERGAGGVGAWLAVRVSRRARTGTRSARSLRSGRAEAQRLSAAAATVGGGHLGGKLGWIHPGLGSARDAEIRVRWPDGQQGDWMPCRESVRGREHAGALVAAVLLTPRR